MIAVSLLILLLQEPPRPEPVRPPREQEAVERLRRELEAMPPNSPQRERKQAELRRLELPQPRPPHPPPRPPAAPENVEEVWAWLRENEPETFRRMEKASEEGRRPEAMRILAEAEPRMRELADLKSRDPKAYEKTQELRRLERESQEVAELARTAGPAEREAAGKKLRATLDRLFDLREEQKGRELEELKRRVAEIEKQLEARKASKERIVERRKRELLGERLPDDW
jgi:hypothetical protein